MTEAQVRLELQLRRSFHQLYGREPRLFSAPGRVNLIGEHADYNEGFVLPIAANRRTFVAAAKREDSLVRVHTLNLASCAEFNLQDEPSQKGAAWLSYVEGVARVLSEQGIGLRGADLAIASDVPIGAGLSSSAALEISVGFALVKLAHNSLNLMDLALAAQLAEHRFVGTMSGLMDQLTAAFGVRNHAMLIDCRSLKRELTAVNIPNTAVVVCNTGVKHDLASSAYNERRNECEQAVTILRQHNPDIYSLRDVTVRDLEAAAEQMPETLLRRCRHVVSENERTLLSAAALKSGNIEQLGALMNLSHESLRNDYEVSCRELDLMVKFSRAQEGVAGSRMMGGGFGGSTVNLVRRDSLNGFREAITVKYQDATGLRPIIFTVDADDGVCEIF